jgi:hypothetical protein
MRKICEKKSDIVEIGSGLMIAKRKIVDCDWGCKGAKTTAQLKAALPNNEPKIDLCKYWCCNSGDFYQKCV